MKIRWSPLSPERIAEIAEYKPKASEKWIESIFKSVEVLVEV